jgi:secondary thiamine-phosphate synthase enzyme
LKTFQKLLEVETRGRGLLNVTLRVQAAVRESGVKNGLCAVFCQHTSASLVVQENADPAVLRDLERWLSDLAPETRNWEHDDEGPDDMPAHARSAVTRSNETLPVSDGQLALGTWQALYVWEHRTSPHRRRLLLTVQGD